MEKQNFVLNMNTRQVHLNLSDIDLDAIYDSITPTSGVIEVVKMHGKNKHCGNMSEHNVRLVNRKRVRRNTDYFHNCIGIYFPTWSLKLFHNGTINAICFPDEETYEKDMCVLFDVLKQKNYTPWVVSQKDILRKKSDA